MRKFTKEEISLCRQVAKKYRIKLENGAYFDDELKEVKFICENSYFQRLVIAQPDSKSFPLWTISDCLEFLREKGFTIVQACEHPMSNEWMIEVNPYFSNAVKIMGHNSFDIRGDTFLIACLKAVLAALGEEK